jgi:hypothetical protein
MKDVKSFISTSLNIVSFRQNGVGPSKSCADAILLKGHGPAAYICDQCILLAAGVLPEPIPQPNSKPNSRSGHENGINERVHEVETVARPTTGAEEERDAGVGR